ncbi:MAG: potassium channel family protein [Flavicella sp.]
MNYKIYKAIVLFFTALLYGVFGYVVCFDFSFVDGLYMTTITLTTVGFGEVIPLTDASKLFTISLIFFSVIIYGYVVSVISEYVSNSNLMEELHNNKMIKRIQKLQGHTIVCGYGRNGRQAAAKLKKYNKPCVVIEKSKTLLKEIDADGFLYFHGDATEDVSLLSAGIARAESLITALPSDADNLYVVLSSRQLNTKANIVSRATDESTEKKLKIAGADNVIMPDRIGGAHMASLLVTPDLVEFVNRISLSGDDAANLEEIAVDALPKQYLLKSIRDLDLRKKTGCNVIGFITAEGDYIINPSSDTILKAKSNLILLGTSEQISKLKMLF